MSADKPKWDPAVDGVAELVEHQRMVKELRALATGWGIKAKGFHERAAQCTGAVHDRLEDRAKDLEDRAKAIFAIVGRE